MNERIKCHDSTQNGEAVLKPEHKLQRMDWARRQMPYREKWYLIIFSDEEKEIYMVRMAVSTTFAKNNGAVLVESNARVDVE